MNLFDFLNKFGSRDHYFQICIEHENKVKYRLNLYKTSFISITNLEIEKDKEDHLITLFLLVLTNFIYQKIVIM